MIFCRGESIFKISHRNERGEKKNPATERVGAYRSPRSYRWVYEEGGDAGHLPGDIASWKHNNHSAAQRISAHMLPPVIIV